jgi:hypothetical protein
MKGVDNAAAREGFDLAQLDAHPFRLGPLRTNADFDGLATQIPLI